MVREKDHYQKLGKCKVCKKFRILSKSGWCYSCLALNREADKREGRKTMDEKILKFRKVLKKNGLKVV